MSTAHARIRVGVDAGKGDHWTVAVEADGKTLFSMKVINGEAQIVTLIEAARERADEVRWAVDISGRSSTPLLTLLVAHGQNVVYVPGRTVNRMSGAYRGKARTDAKDALVIADTARVRRDFTPLTVPDDTPAASPRTRAWPPYPATPAAGQATTTGPSATAGACGTSSRLRWPGRPPRLRPGAYQMPLHPPCSGGKRWP
ncbi:hypothetical protein SANTM175S_09358 [Streptomyces antimycoticus]